MFIPEGIIIHCSATPPNWMKGKGIKAKRDEIERWHVNDRGWRGIAYAELIDYDGSTAAGRDLDKDGDPFDEAGAHTKGWNSKAIGICLIGGHGSASTDNFFEHFTPEQDEALRRRIATLKARFPSIKWVKGHNDFAAKACPGFRVDEWLTNSKKKGDGLLDSGTNKAAIGTVVTTVGTAVAPVVADNEQAQTILTAGLTFAGVCFVGYIIYSRVLKQRRGIL